MRNMENELIKRVALEMFDINNWYGKSLENEIAGTRSRDGG